MALLELRNIAKHFGATEALNGVDLRLEPGEVLGLMGDDGAGKSTLVKIIGSAARRAMTKAGGRPRLYSHFTSCRRGERSAVHPYRSYRPKPRPVARASA